MGLAFVEVYASRSCENASIPLAAVTEGGHDKTSFGSIIA